MKNKTDQIADQIRGYYPEQCVEQLYGMTCSLESSVEEFAKHFPDCPIGTIVLAWLSEAGEPTEDGD